MNTDGHSDDITLSNTDIYLNSINHLIFELSYTDLILLNDRLDNIKKNILNVRKQIFHNLRNNMISESKVVNLTTDRDYTNSNIRIYLNGELDMYLIVNEYFVKLNYVYNNIKEPDILYDNNDKDKIHKYLLSYLKNNDQIDIVLKYIFRIRKELFNIKN